MLRNVHMPLRLKFVLLAIFFCFYISTYQVFKNNGNNNYKSIVYENEIREVLADTPYLWRKFTFPKNETPSTRVEAQQLWIQRISQLQYIRFAKIKNIFVESGDLEFFYGTEGKLKCPYAPDFQSKCNVIHESWKETFMGLLKYDKIDAVVGVRNWIRKLYEPMIPLRVKRFLYILEPPHLAKDAILGRNHALLASYWKGSDIPVPYRQWTSNGTYPRNLTELEIYALSKKTKKVVAVVSNCETSNGRLDFIHELQKYIPVDVYGRCGNFSCPREKNNDCLSMLGKDYKYFLAIENSNCADYITEKFFDNALKYNMVPIAMGAHPDEYKLAAPPHSYIHVNDFESPEALAKYLNFLDTHEDLYLEYFRWKDAGYINKNPMEDFFCRVCGMLFYADFVDPPSTWNSSTALWEDVNKCLKEGQWYWPN